MRARPFLVVLLVACGAGLLASAVSPAAKRPKVTAYGATLDVSGWVTVDIDYDSTDECRPGQRWHAQMSLDVDTGKPLPVTVTTVNGLVLSTVVRKPRGAKHKTKITNYGETNHCPPDKPEKLPDPPECKALTGALDTSISKAPALFDNEDDEGALTHRTGLFLHRVGGGDQPTTCLGLAELRPRSGTTALSTLEHTFQAMSLPLRITDTKILKLKVGRTLRDTVRIGGACNAFLVNPSSARAAFKDTECTVKGAFQVALKRTVH